MGEACRIHAGIRNLFKNMNAKFKEGKDRIEDAGVMLGHVKL